MDATRYVTWELINSALGDGSGGHEKVAAELDAVGFNYSEATISYGRNIQTGSFMVLKPLLRRGHGVLTTTLKENG